MFSAPTSADGGADESDAELVAALKKILRDAFTKDDQAILAAWANDESLADIARRLGLAAGTVRQRFRRAKKKIQEKLRELSFRLESQGAESDGTPDPDSPPTDDERKPHSHHPGKADEAIAAPTTEHPEEPLA
jgi:hypothetical protein